MASASNTESVANLIARIQSSDETVSTPAWQNAWAVGAPAVQPLVELMAFPEPELARRARRALDRIIHHASHPKLARERHNVERALIEALPTAPIAVRRIIVWFLSEIGGSKSVPPVAAQLSHPEVREDARCALTRLPSSSAVRALRSSFDSAPEPFKFALAESLRLRGQKITGYPSRKLIPTASTEVRPLKGKAG